MDKNGKGAEAECYNFRMLALCHICPKPPLMLLFGLGNLPSHSENRERRKNARHTLVHAQRSRRQTHKIASSIQKQSKTNTHTNASCTHLEEFTQVVRQRRQGEPRQVDEGAHEQQDQQDGVPRLQVGVGNAHERLTLAQDARERVVPGAGRTKNGILIGYSEAGQAKHAKGY